MLSIHKPARCDRHVLQMPVYEGTESESCSQSNFARGRRCCTGGSTTTTAIYRNTLGTKTRCFDSFSQPAGSRQGHTGTFLD